MPLAIYGVGNGDINLTYNQYPFNIREIPYLKLYYKV